MAGRKELKDSDGGAPSVLEPPETVTASGVALRTHLVKAVARIVPPILSWRP